MASKQQLIKDFKDIFLGFIENVYLLCPNSILTNNKSIINGIINNKPELIMNVYMSKVLVYKNEFEKDPEKFISTHNFEDDLDDNDKNDIKDYINQIFIFKNIWNGLTKQNKDIIIKYIKYLNTLSEKYINL